MKRKKRKQDLEEGQQ